MWLGSIQRTSNDTLGRASAVTLPPTFFPDLMPNRVGGTTTGHSALFRFGLELRRRVVRAKGPYLRACWSKTRYRGNSQPDGASPNN